MFTNANGKRKCRKMRRLAGIPIMRRKIAFSAPVSCALAESSSCSFFALLRQECAFLRHVLLPFLPSFSRPSFSRFFLLFPSFRSLFVFILLPSACVLPSSRLFLFSLSFFREGGYPPFHLRQGKNEEGKVTFAFLFLFVCSPEEGKESVLSFLSSSREGERKCVLSVL